MFSMTGRPRKYSLTPMDQLMVPVSDGWTPTLPTHHHDSGDSGFLSTESEKSDQSLPDMYPSAMSPSAASPTGIVQSVEDLVFELFKTPDKDEISVWKFLSILGSSGLRRTDPRFKEMMARVKEVDHSRRTSRDHHDDDAEPVDVLVDRESFKKCIAPAMVLVVRALQNQLIIPEWNGFCKQIGEIFEIVKPIKEGKNAQYIPQLARVNPNYWAVSVCTVDGQRHSWGDFKKNFCFQSVCKAFNYALALNDLGAEVVHNHVGQEPSGRLFNEICLNHDMQPHNPMINAGAILICSLLKREEKLADRFDWVMEMYRKFAGGEDVGFSNQTFLSERETADRNFALAYFMRENKCFPDGAALQETLDLYFQLCSMEVNCDTLAVMTATLANGGICPLTGDRVVSNRACRDTLSLMHSCGMYDYSGQWAFKVGLPAKSGVSGAIAVVIPNVMGITMFSPPLDRLGNSVKGIAFCKEMVERFNFHNYDSILNRDEQKIDPRRRQTELQGEQVVYILFAAKTGDLNALKQYAMRGLSFDMKDYDGRTAAHIAASEGHLHVLEFLRHTAKTNPVQLDRWNRTPLDDAKQFGHAQCVTFLEDWIADSLVSSTSSSTTDLKNLNLKS